MDVALGFSLPAEVINDPGLLAEIKARRLFPFPETPEEIRAEAEEVEDLSAEERIDRLFKFIREGEEFLARNPAVRQAYERYKSQSETAWQKTQRELFERYGVYCNADQ